MSKLFISANRFLNESFLLADKIYESNFNPDIVIGIWRGGSIPGIVIHEFLQFRGLKTKSAVITTRSYTGIGEQSEHVDVDISEKVLGELINANNILIVDDVLDTGKTIEAIYRYFKNNNITGKIKVASVYYKPATSSILPDYYIHETNKWIVFPHELEGLLPDEIKNKHLDLSMDH
tara:strand:+ start:18 stop:548 length:531 start_codon:yes stop_codon:yes gene_type:complete